MEQPRETPIVCLGDSLTWGFPYGPEYSWVHIVKQRILEKRIVLVNRGINGDTTEGMLERFESSVCSQHPVAVIVLGGTNDILVRESLSRVEYNIEHIVAKARENAIKIILGLPIPLGWAEPERRLTRLREWIRAYAQEHDLKCIDFAAPFYRAGSLEIRHEFYLDGGHPTKEGYQLMADQVDLRLLQALIEPS